jgi:hypothetical protein
VVWPSDAPHAAVVHSDEALIDLVQFELERAGIRTDAVVLADHTGADSIAAYLRPVPDVCVVGVSPPLHNGVRLIADLRSAMPLTRLVVLTPAPLVVGRWVDDLIEECVTEGPDLDRSVGATVEVVRRMLNPAIPIRDARFMIRRARAAVAAALQERDRSAILRAEARELRLRVAAAPPHYWAERLASLHSGR